MIDNSVIRALMSHRSIRRFTDRMPSKEAVETIVRAGQQAAFAYQMTSVLLSRDRKRNPFHAPLCFTTCIDAHRTERVMKQRGWKLVSCDLNLLMFGLVEASLMAQNMAVAAESLGLGTVYLGLAPAQAAAIAKEYSLPRRVFPVVYLAAGFPAENPPPRPRYPMEFTLFEDRYPKLTDKQVARAMATMDRGYLAQGYYRNVFPGHPNFMIPLIRGRKETYDIKTYSWTEHISRKLGQWRTSPDEMLGVLARRGFNIIGRTRSRKTAAARNKPRAKK